MTDEPQPHAFPAGAADSRDLLASTSADGTLILTPCGPLKATLSEILLHAAAAAASAGIAQITVDLGRIPRYDDAGVHAVRGCRRLAEHSGTTIRFLTRGGSGQALLLASYGDEPSSPAVRSGG